MRKEQKFQTRNTLLKWEHILRGCGAVSRSRASGPGPRQEGAGVTGKQCHASRTDRASGGSDPESEASLGEPSLCPGAGSVLAAGCGWPTKKARAGFYTSYNSMKDAAGRRKAGVSECKVIVECKAFLWAEFHGSLSLTWVPELWNMNIWAKE